jgi:hypothetical protein
MPNPTPPQSFIEQECKRFEKELWPNPSNGLKDFLRTALTTAFHSGYQQGVEAEKKAQQEKADKLIAALQSGEIHFDTLPAALTSLKTK